MGIISYDKRNKKLEEQLFNSSEISQTNKDIVKRFLLTYDVSLARMNIFLERITPFLKQFDDIKSIERDDLNLWFYDYKQHYAPSTLATYTSVIRRLMRWVHDGQLPSTYTDLKVSKKDMRRDLKPEDMTLWKEGLAISRLTNSVQLQAALLTQLDGGFRPSEFIIPYYGDITLVDDLYVWHVRDGKTGPRSVVLYRSTPYLKTWMEQHPDKQPNSPLWINERKWISEGAIEEAKYPALAKRVKTLGRIANSKKPMDFYALRHSSCAMDKRDNIPLDLAAERHGHSIKYFMEVYGRLDINDVVSRFKSHFGIKSNIPKENKAKLYTPQQVDIKPSTSDAETKAQTVALQHQINKLQAQLMSMQKTAL